MSNELTIEHDGDTWRVLGTGVDSGNKRLCHLASTTRFQWNSDRPIQISDFVPIATLTAVEVAKPVAAAPAKKHPALSSTPKDHRIDDLEDALQLAVRAIQNLLPGGVNHPQANHGLINEAILTARALLQSEKPDA